MFCADNHSKQKDTNRFVFPVVKSYKYLGITITNKGSLKKHCKPTKTKMMIKVCKLASVKSDKIPPSKMRTLFLIESKSVLDYSDPALYNQVQALHTQINSNSGYFQRNFALRKVKISAIRNLLILKKISHLMDFRYIYHIVHYNLL